MSQPLLDDVAVDAGTVHLRPARPLDADALFDAIHRRRPVLDQLVWQGPADLNELREAYGTWRVLAASGAVYKFTVERAADGLPIGTCSLRFTDHPFVGDIGYWVGEDHWGRGHGSNLVAGLRALAFGPLRSTSMVAEVFPGNPRSEGALVRNGFRRVRTAPDSTPAEGPLRARHLFQLLPAAHRAHPREDVRVRATLMGDDAR